MAKRQPNREGVDVEFPVVTKNRCFCNTPEIRLLKDGAPIWPSVSPTKKPY